MINTRETAVRKRRAGAEDVEIGRKIRALRLERGLSQSGLAEGIGLVRPVEPSRAGGIAVEPVLAARVVLEQRRAAFGNGVGAHGRSIAAGKLPP